MMSVQEMWFAATSSGRWLDSVPLTWMRSPSALMISRCQILRMNVSGHQPVFIDTICSGTRINEPTTTRANARKILIFLIIRPWPCRYSAARPFWTRQGRRNPWIWRMTLKIDSDFQGHSLPLASEDRGA